MHPNSWLNHLELDAPLSLGSDDGVLYFYIPSDEITAFLHLTNHITTTTSWRIESNREFKAISLSKRDTSRLVDTWNTQISGHLLQPNKSRRDHYCSFVCYCYFLSHFVYTQTLRAKPDSHWRRSADWLYGDSRARLNVVKFLGTRPNQHTATICNPKHTNTINPTQTCWSSEARYQRHETGRVSTHDQVSLSQHATRNEEINQPTWNDLRDRLENNREIPNT